MLRVYKKDGTITYYWLWMAITFLYHLKSAYASKLGHCLFLHALTNFFSSFSTSVPGTVPHIRNRIKLSKHDFCPQRAQLRGKYTKHDDFFFFNMSEVCKFPPQHEGRCFPFVCRYYYVLDKFQRFKSGWHQVISS